MPLVQCFSRQLHTTNVSQHHWAEVWERASQLADAYKIGRSESGAALMLLNSVGPDVVSKLSEVVKCFDSSKLYCILHPCCQQLQFVVSAPSRI